MTQTQTTEREVTAWEIAAFAAPAAPLLALSLPTIIFIPPYFASHLGIPLYVVSAIFLGVRVADIVIDPANGSPYAHWSDLGFTPAPTSPLLERTFRRQPPGVALAPSDRWGGLLSSSGLLPIGSVPMGSRLMVVGRPA